MTTPASHPDTEPPAGFRVVEISREPVELYKILKFESLASNGGQAKAVVAAGQVLVNGEVETQKRKKIISGDTIEFIDHKICIKLSSSVSLNVAPPIKGDKGDKEDKGDGRLKSRTAPAQETKTK
jgi:ribosome-associated protein